MESKENLVRQLVAAKAAKTEAELEVESLDAALSLACERDQTKFVEAIVDGEPVTATMVSATRVVYDSKVLKEVLGDQWEQVVTISEKVDSEKVGRLAMSGELSEENIRKAATLKKSRSYFRLS